MSSDHRKRGVSTDTLRKTRMAVFDLSGGRGVGDLISTTKRKATIRLPGGKYIKRGLIKHHVEIYKPGVVSVPKENGLMI